MLNRLFTKKKKGEKRKKKNEENCSEFLDSLVGTIMHTIFQENNKGYDIKLFFFFPYNEDTPTNYYYIVLKIHVGIFNYFDE